MKKFNRVLILLLSLASISYSSTCFAYRYDISPGSPTWIVWGNIITLAIVWYFANKRIKEAIEYEESLYELYNDWLLLLFILVVITVVLAWFNLPSGYYIYIHRPILFISAVVAIFKVLSSEIISKKSLWVMGFFAILHNPISPVVLGSGAKPIWVVLNIIYVLSLAVVWDPSENDEDEEEGEEDRIIAQKRYEYEQELIKKEEDERNAKIQEIAKNMIGLNHTADSIKKNILDQRLKAFTVHIILYSLLIYTIISFIEIPEIHQPAIYIVTTILLILFSIFTSKLVVKRRENQYYSVIDELERNRIELKRLYNGNHTTTNKWYKWIIGSAIVLLVYLLN